MDVLSSFPPPISPLPCISIAIALVLLQFRTFLLTSSAHSLATIGLKSQPTPFFSFLSLLPPPYSLSSSSCPLYIWLYSLSLFFFSTLVTNYPKIVSCRLLFHRLSHLVSRLFLGLLLLPTSTLSLFFSLFPSAQSQIAPFSLFSSPPPSLLTSFPFFSTFHCHVKSCRFPARPS